MYLRLRFPGTLCLLGWISIVTLVVGDINWVNSEPIIDGRTTDFITEVNTDVNNCSIGSPLNRTPSNYKFPGKRTKNPETTKH